MLQLINQVCSKRTIRLKTEYTSLMLHVKRESGLSPSPYKLLQVPVFVPSRLSVPGSQRMGSDVSSMRGFNRRLGPQGEVMSRLLTLGKYFNTAAKKRLI